MRSRRSRPEAWTVLSSPQASNGKNGTLRASQIERGPFVLLVVWKERELFVTGSCVARQILEFDEPRRRQIKGLSSLSKPFGGSARLGQQEIGARSMSDFSLGVLISFVAGALNGSFATPTKYMKLWRWENVWAAWAVVAFFLFPWVLALNTVPDLFGLYRSAGPGPMLMLVGLGAGVGIAQICFGLGVSAIGIALNFAIAIGISTTLGSLVPLLSMQSQVILTPKGLSIMAGVTLMLIGIVICAVAGKAKDIELGCKRDGDSKTSFARGLLLAIVAGVLSPLQNFGLAYGQVFLTRAAEHGVSPARQADVIWPPLLTATLAPYLIYCLHLWRKNKSFGLYRRSARWWYWIAAIVMGSLWMGSVALYGTASAKMGTLGPIFAWPLFMSVIIVCSNCWGFATGEWKGVSRKPAGIMLFGILFLILGFCTIAYSARLR